MFCLRVGNKLFKKLSEIKKEVVKFYKNFYKQSLILKLLMTKEGLLFFLVEQRRYLEIFLIRKEIKMVVWNCEAFKVSGYDDFSMGFI